MVLKQARRLAAAALCGAVALSTASSARAMSNVRGVLRGDAAGSFLKYTVHSLAPGQDVMVTLLQNNSPCLEGLRDGATDGQVFIEIWTGPSRRLTSVEQAACRQSVTFNAEAGGPATVVVANYSRGYMLEFELIVEGTTSTIGGGAPALAGAGGVGSQSGLLLSAYETPAITSQVGLFAVLASPGAPTITSAPSDSVRPGVAVTLAGSGFVPGSQVFINQEVAKSRVIDSGHIKFRLFRPLTVEQNNRADMVQLQVVNPNGERSNEVPLAIRNFRMVAVGDSVMWGQGLYDEEKFTSIVASRIQAKLGDQRVVLQGFSHSGAIIGLDTKPSGQPSSYEEASADRPTIYDQVKEFNDDPKSVDLILLDGCANDVDIRFFLSPAMAIGHSARRDVVERKTRSRCYWNMITLLDAVDETFSDAAVIVTGYYPMVSKETDTSIISPILDATGTVSGGAFVFVCATCSAGVIVYGLVGDEVLRDEIAWQSDVFVESANRNIRSAVDDRNAQPNSRRRIRFVDPGFGASNAILASDPWLWGLKRTFEPEDNVIRARATACSHLLGQPAIMCYRASVGHPNPLGARVFADAIIATSASSQLIDEAIPEMVVSVGTDRAGIEGAVIPFEATVANAPVGVHAEWIWGDGTPPEAAALTPTDIPGTLHASGTHVWGDNGSFSVDLDVTDGRTGASDWDDLVLAVENVAPSVSALTHTPDQAYPGQTVLVAAHFTDPGWLDSHAATIAWGDDKPSTVASVTESNLPPQAVGDVRAEHRYSVPGTYTITVTLTDDDGGTTSLSTPIVVELSPDMPGMIPIAAHQELTFYQWTGTLATPRNDWQNHAENASNWWLYEAGGWLYFWRVLPGDVPTYVSSAPAKPSDPRRNVLAYAVRTADFQHWIWCGVPTPSGCDANYGPQPHGAGTLHPWLTQRIGECR